MAEMFTIEQVELLRRLRSTGITADQIIQAFNSFDRMDRDLPKDVQPRAVPQKDHSTAAWNYCTDVGTNSRPTQQSSSMHAGAMKHEGSMEHNAINLGRYYQQHQQQMATAAQHYGHASPDNASSAGTPESQQALLYHQASSLQQQQLAAAATTFGQLQDPSSFLGHSVDRQPFQITEDNEQLAELMRNGDDAALDEIRQFVAKHCLRQQTIAQMTQISQPYVSKFLRGETKEISYRIKTTMYNWYLTLRNNPKKLSSFCADSSKRQALQDAGEPTPQRRERFTFRPFHSEILERAYLEDPYPDQTKRQDLVNACNDATIAHNQAKREQLAVSCSNPALAYKPDPPLASRDIVTAQVITNWFANKRKEMKCKGEPPACYYQPYHVPPRRGRRPNSDYTMQLRQQQEESAVKQELMTPEEDGEEQDEYAARLEDSNASDSEYPLNAGDMLEEGEIGFLHQANHADLT